MNDIVDAITALRTRLDHGATGVVSVTMPARWSTSMLLQFARIFADHGPRMVLIDAGSDRPAATIGIGAAASSEILPTAFAAQESVRQFLSQDDRRVVLVAVPFAPTSTTARAVYVPRVWLRQRTGEALPELAVDVGDGDSDDVMRLLQLLHDDPQPFPTSSASTSASFVRVDAPDERGHAAAVNAALAAIDRGDISKVVLARRSTLSTGPVRGTQLDDVLAGLLQREQRGTAYLVVNDAGDDAFFGCSPERLCVRRGRHLDVDALAGTAARGHDNVDDEALAQRLRTDGKERREHAAVVDAVVSALRPLSASLDFAHDPAVVRLGRVQHLHTSICARLVDDAPVFAALHPTPAVAGTPRAAAVSLLQTLEPFARGLYAGFIGVADAGGEDLTVALRCGRAHDDVVDVYAGSGLVAGAVAQREWFELERKAALMFDVLHDVLHDVCNEQLHA